MTLLLECEIQWDRVEQYGGPPLGQMTLLTTDHVRSTLCRTQVPGYLHFYIY